MTTTTPSVQDKSGKDRVIIFDTTLRDGEQCPGATMTFEEKLDIAAMLDAMGVDVIEAGFPIASDGDFEAVHEIAKRSKNAVICGLSRAGAKDIDRCAEAIKPAKRGRIHSFLSTSPVHMKFKLQMEPDAVHDLVISSVTRARNHTDDVEWSAEDGTRTEFDFLCRCIESAIKAGATTINIPDTVGYSVPEEYYDLFKRVRENVPNSDKAVFSVHCHNDLGMAVANSMAGIRGGARQIECTINGIGERAGNAALEEIVMAIKTRNDKLPYWNNIDTTMLTRASKVVSAATSFPVQYNKAIVGRNAFAHESGIHQDGMLKNAQTYEIMLPETVGVKQTSLVMGKHSGRHAFIHKLEEMGHKLGANQLGDAFVRFKALADRKKDIYDEDLEALVDQEMTAAHDRIKLASLTVIAGTHGPQRATMKLDIDGVMKLEEAEGNGPVDAVFNCIKALVPHEAKLELYQVHAVTQGTDAQAEVSVRLAHEGRSMTARAADPDTLVASAKAYLGALNKIVMKRQRDMPQVAAAS
ncbi:2-isopropylmalate synthase [Tardiphaga sp.]|uniref:2-isopropylmalate synthase n=1 Tax=Tardiphaga sp. TaxID=1926292 RepID=UPI0025EB3468|nr:2-isopropylmalate synthase [Tardiphaga sp.]